MSGIIFALLLSTTPQHARFAAYSSADGLELTVALTILDTIPIVVFGPDVNTLDYEVLESKNVKDGEVWIHEWSFGNWEFMTRSTGEIVRWSVSLSNLFEFLNVGEYVVRLWYDDSHVNSVAEMHGWSERSAVGRCGDVRLRVFVPKSRKVKAFVIWDKKASDAGIAGADAGVPGNGAGRP